LIVFTYLTQDRDPENLITEIAVTPTLTSSGYT
jgi:hypothetical protein